MFENSHAKIARAKVHIDDLSLQEEVFFIKAGYRLVVEDDRQKGFRSIRVKASCPLPTTLSMILGDAVHNLRAALDLLVYEIAIPLGAQPDKVQFPFCKEAGGRNFESVVKNRQLHILPDHVKQLLFDIKPYPEGNEALYGLHRLDITDKHKLIIPATSLTSVSLDLRGLDPTAPPFRVEDAGGEVNNVTLVRWPLNDRSPTQSRVQRRLDKVIDGHRPFSMMFARGQPFYTLAVIPKLEELATLVKDVVNRFEEAKR